MFGYVRPLLDELPQKEQDRFRRLYCGLCQTLKERYGFAAQWILNFDFTFLAALFSAADEEKTCRCVANPFRKRTVLCPGEALELAADDSVILTYWQLQDHVQDSSFWKKEGAVAAAQVLRRAYDKARRLRPGFDCCVQQSLSKLHVLEKEHCTSLDRTADCFAVLLQGAAAELPQGGRKRVLEQLLYHLGRWIYLIDAVDDLEKDAADGAYNPLLFHYEESRLSPAHREELMITLQHSLNMMASAYALEEFGPWAPILENILYRSLFAVSKAVFDGTFHRQRRMLLQKKQNAAEGTKES